MRDKIDIDILEETRRWALDFSWKDRALVLVSAADTAAANIIHVKIYALHLWPPGFNSVKAFTKRKEYEGGNL